MDTKTKALPHLEAVETVIRSLKAKLDGTSSAGYSAQYDCVVQGLYQALECRISGRECSRVPACPVHCAGDKLEMETEDRFAG